MPSIPKAKMPKYNETGEEASEKDVATVQEEAVGHNRGGKDRGETASSRVVVCRF